MGTLHAIVEEYKYSYKVAKSISKLFNEDSQLEMSMLSAVIVGRFITEKWPTLTQKQTKTDFIQNLSAFKSVATDLQDEGSNDWIEIFKSYFNETEFQFIKQKLTNANKASRKQFDSKFKKSFIEEIDYICDKLQVRFIS